MNIEIRLCSVSPNSYDVLNNWQRAPSAYDVAKKNLL